MGYALLIDDDETILSRATRAAEENGLTLETATTWEEGLAKFHAHSPEVVISDYNLPGSDMGLSLLVEIARLRPSTKLILISSYLNEADAVSIRALDVVDDVMSKIDPVDTARMVVQETRLAAERAKLPTDWTKFAQAAGAKRSVDPEALKELDRFLQVNRLPEDNS